MIFFPEKHTNLPFHCYNGRFEMISHFSTFECFGFDHREITRTLLPVMKFYYISDLGDMLDLKSVEK